MTATDHAVHTRTLNSKVALRRALRDYDVSSVLDEVIVYLMESEATFGSPQSLFHKHYDRMMRNQTNRHSITAMNQKAKDYVIPVHIMDISAVDMRTIHVDLLELRDKHTVALTELMKKDETIRDLRTEMVELMQRNTSLQVMGLATRGEAKITEDLKETIAGLQTLNCQLAEEYEILRRNVEFGFVADAQELSSALDERKTECDGLAATNTLLATALLHLQDEMRKLQESLQLATKELHLANQRANLFEKDLRELRGAAEEADQSSPQR